MLKVHKIVLLRWIARGEVQHPVYYCFQNGMSLLWADRDVKAIRVLAASKKRKRLAPIPIVVRVLISEENERRSAKCETSFGLD